MVIREKETPSARALRPEVPEGLDAIIKRCLEKDRSLRFRDVGEFAQALVDYASPAVSHSISRIKRIVEEKKERLALASTEAEEDEKSADERESDAENDEDLGATAHVPSGKDEVAAAGRSPAANSVGSGSAPLVSPLTASLAAVSSSTTNPSVEIKRRRARIAVLALGGLGLIGLAVVGRLALAPAGSTAPSQNGGSLVAEAAALPPPSTPIALPEAAPESPAASAPSAGVSTAPAMAPAPPPPAPTPAASTRIAKPIATPAKSVTTAATPPSAPAPESCDPPWTIDENGIKRLKKHCK
jgi:serine/threonine-protein kinase